MLNHKDPGATLIEVGIITRSHPEVFLGKVVLKICSNFTGEHQCRRAILINLLCHFSEIVLRHGCSLVICCIFSENLFLRTPLDGCFCIMLFWINKRCIQNFVKHVTLQKKWSFTLLKKPLMEKNFIFWTV